MTLALAYLLDLSVGDPRWLPHPVRGLGWLIQRGERLSRAWIRDEAAAGWFLLAGIALGTFACVEGLLWGARQILAWLAYGVEVGLLYACLSTRDLAAESWPVYRALAARDLPRARAKVAMIVGRDTESLSSPEIVRATVETIGESAMDGIIAPLFYAAVGGVPLACVYKAVNTLDSMVGFRSARYLKFGRATAKMDSWMNYIPARLTSWLIAAGAQITGFSAKRALKAFRRDALPHKENSFMPEAALGGALGVQLGGLNFYQGKPVEAPRLGDPDRPLSAEVIPQAIRVMVACSLLGFAAALLTRWGIERLIR